MKSKRTKEDLINEFVMKSQMGSNKGEEIYKLLQQHKVECMVSPSGDYQIVLVAPPFKNMGLETIEKNGESLIQVTLDYDGTRFATTFPMKKGVKMVWVNEIEKLQNQK